MGTGPQKILKPADQASTYSLRSRWPRRYLVANQLLSVDRLRLGTGENLLEAWMAAEGVPLRGNRRFQKILAAPEPKTIY